MRPERLWVIGAGGHAKVVIATARAIGWQVAGVWDDNPALKGTSVLDAPVIGSIPDAQWWRGQPEPAFLAIGSNRVRQTLARQIEPGGGWATLVHPTAWREPSAVLAAGVLVCAGVILQPAVQVGEHAILNTGAIVEHDGRVGAFAHLAPRVCLAGSVTVEEGAFVGTGAVVIPGGRIGAWAGVGAGAAVIRPVTDGTRVAGVPARVLPVSIME